MMQRQLRQLLHAFLYADVFSTEQISDACFIIDHFKPLISINLTIQKPDVCVSNCLMVISPVAGTVV
jgi:hypothetical protein